MCFLFVTPAALKHQKKFEIPDYHNNLYEISLKTLLSNTFMHLIDLQLIHDRSYSEDLEGYMIP